MLTTRPSGTSRQPIRIAIAGGGIAGLCLTIGLLRYPHIEVHIYEAAAKFSEIGAGVAFGINAQRALCLLDPRIKPAYEKIGTTNVSSNVDKGNGKSTYFKVQLGMDHRDGKTKAGDTICEVMCQGGFSSVHRANFLEEMVAILPADIRRHNVSFGHRVVDIKEGEGRKGVLLSFANGKTATADALIGCDGIKSEIRKILLGRASSEASAKFTGKYAYRGLIPMEKAAAALGENIARNSRHYHGYDGHVLTFPIEKGKTMNVVAFRTKVDGKWEDEEWIKPAERKDMESDFRGWGDSVQKILKMMQKCDKWALFDHPHATTYHKDGNICLVGDAAHASTPHQGSGAGMAVEDAYVLSGLLGEIRDTNDLESAFVAYEKIRMERTQRLVQSSREQAMIYEWQADGIGDNLQKISEILPYRWDWIWDEDLEDELKEGISILQRSTLLTHGHAEQTR